MRLDRRTDEFDSFPERDGELELPDDLAAMGEQLADDAQRLAACYPPQYGPVTEVAAAVRDLAASDLTMASAGPRSQIRKRRWLALSIGGGLVALGLLAVLILGNKEDDPRSLEEQLASGTSGQRTPAEDATQRLVARQPTHVPRHDAPELAAHDRFLPDTASDAIPPPAVFQRGVTGPEVEGWIDLAMDTESLEF
jgi:hypothetical protein